MEIKYYDCANVELVINGVRIDSKMICSIELDELEPEPRKPFEYTFEYKVSSAAMKRAARKAVRRR